MAVGFRQSDEGALPLEHTGLILYLFSSLRHRPGVFLGQSGDGFCVLIFIDLPFYSTILLCLCVYHPPHSLYHLLHHLVDSVEGGQCQQEQCSLQGSKHPHLESWVAHYDDHLRVVVISRILPRPSAAVLRRRMNEWSCYFVEGNETHPCYFYHSGLHHSPCLFLPDAFLCRYPFPS